METKKVNSELADNLAFGEVIFVKPASEEDMMQGIDAWLGGIPFAWRRRRISLKQYGEISIRRSIASGSKTEYDKLLNGDFQALIYIFQYTDAIVICLTKDIVNCIQAGKYSKKDNHNGMTSALYINLQDINHLVLWNKVN